MHARSAIRFTRFRSGHSPNKILFVYGHLLERLACLCRSEGHFTILRSDQS